MEIVQAARGQGRGRPGGRGRGRGRVAADVPMQDAHHAAPFPAQQGAAVNPDGPAPAPQPAAQPELAVLVTALLQRIEAQEVEIQELRNHLPQVNGNMGEDQEAPPVPPQGVHQMGQVVVADDLFERFKRMRASDFEGSTDPLVADEWMSEMKKIFNFMNISEIEKVICASFVMKKDTRYWWETVAVRRDTRAMSWDDFIEEFISKYFNMCAMNTQQKEFTELKQGTMTVTVAVRKFNQLARLCPHLVPTESERVRRMMGMFRPELALAIDSGSHPPSTVADCLERAMRAEYHLVQVKEERDRYIKARKEEKTQSKGICNNKKFDERLFNNQVDKAQYLENENGKKRNHPENNGNANYKVKMENGHFRSVTHVGGYTQENVRWAVYCVTSAISQMTSLKIV